MVGENTVLQLNILETGVLTLVAQNSSPTRLRLVEFDFIECFTTTFLRAHYWLNWVNEDDDEDEVGLKEKPEDTIYIKKITSK